MLIKFYVVCAFTDGPNSGNPAAVCILKEKIADRDKQSLATRINLSETAFILQDGDVFGLRWFTPQTEVDLCGHATLASAHILFELNIISGSQPAVFSTRSGTISAIKKNRLVEMDFPSEAPQQTDVPDDLLTAIPATPLYVGKNRFDYLALYQSEEIIRNATPNFSRIKNLKSRGLVITSSTFSKKYDFVSRFFAPNVGIDEDPVTGSAHCCLCPFWSQMLGRTDLIGYQASCRGGLVHTRLVGDRVFLSGKVTTLKNIEIDFPAK